MIPNYQVIFRDWNFDKVIVLAGTRTDEVGLQSIQYKKYVNRLGSYVIQVKGDISFSDDIDLDYIVEVLRRPLGSADWYSDYIGLHRTPVWQVHADGAESFFSYGYDLKHLLMRRTIAYASETDESSKDDVSETVAKEYVRENVGDLAAAARQFSDFTVEADSAAGPVWEGSRARDNLLEVLQDIADADGGDFDVVFDPDSGFEFRWYYPFNGVDRRSGTDEPVVFSLEHGNMIVPITSYNRSREVNYLYVLGQGKGEARTVASVFDDDLIDDSPWNRMEASRQASNQRTESALEQVGEEWLASNYPREATAYQVLQSVSSAYGLHYSLGDYVTGIYGRVVEKRISGVSVKVTGDAETISVMQSDVYRL